MSITPEDNKLQELIHSWPYAMLIKVVVVAVKNKKQFAVY